MPDRDDLGHAWRVPPSEYLKRRPKTHAVPEPKSCYVPLRDGVRLAVDFYVPPAKAGAQFPCIVILTPYYRRFAVSGPGSEPAPNVAKYRDFFVPRGYAMVAVDVRGTGASFGTRDAFRSPREREDHGEIADWIVKQPWSNGVIGSTGISYLGAAACFLASTGHPAVKAIAPLFAVHDTYADHVFPGGIMCTTVTENYDDLVSALDLDQRDKLGPYAYFCDPRYAGPAPVDEDPEGALVRAAIEDHRHGYRLRDLAPELSFREDPTPHDPDLHSGACSPYYFPAFEAPAAGTPFPPPTGPVLAFTVGWTAENASSLRQTLVRDTQVIFATRSGYSPASRYGAGVNGGAGTHPVGAAYFDRSADLDWDKRKDGYRFFVPYATDVILDVSPAHANSSNKLLR